MALGKKISAAEEGALVTALAKMKLAQTQGLDMDGFRQGFFTALILITSEPYAQAIDGKAAIAFRKMLTTQGGPDGRS